MIGTSCFVTAVKADEIGNYDRSRKNKSYLTCVQWTIFLPSCTHMPLDLPGQPPHVKDFPLLHPRAIRFPRSNRQIPTSRISSAFSGRYFSLAGSR